MKSLKFVKYEVKFNDADLKAEQTSWKIQMRNF